MSDENDAGATDGAAPEALPQPNPVLARPPVNKLPVEDDKGVFGLLGLPFYYRHTPPRATGRGLFWTGFIILLAILLLNIIWMPYDRDTIMYAIRHFLFGSGRGYISFEESSISIFNQMFVIAIVMSGIIAPLYSTFSLSQERILGTMEFLKLSPMSTTSIVLGKIFAPAYVIHLFSGALLLVGSIFGLLGGHQLDSICLGLMAIILSCASLNALGALLAAFTTSFRGSGSTLLLIILGLCWSTFPLGALRENGFEFLGYISPWGVMDSLFWHEYRRWGTVARPVLFMGSAGYLKFFVIFFNLLATGLLVTAASRRLDAPEKPALPYGLWLLFWCFALATALGIVANFSETQRTWGRMPVYTYSYQWTAGAAVMAFSGLAITLLFLFDHPHDRDTRLADECERLAGKNTPSPHRLGALTHAFAVTGMAMVTMLTVFLFNCLSEIKSPDGLAWAALVGIPAIAFVASLALEAAYISYTSNWAKVGGGGSALFLIVMCALVPVIHASEVHSRHSQALHVAKSCYVQQNRGQGNTYLAYYFQDPNYAEFLTGVDSEETVDTKIAEAPDMLTVFWRYRPTACMVYPAVLVLMVLLVVIWRQRSQSRLRREAREAMNRTRAGHAPPEHQPTLVAATTS